VGPRCLLHISLIAASGCLLAGRSDAGPQMAVGESGLPVDSPAPPWRAVPHDGAFAKGRVSGDLFDMPNGINEFYLLHDGGAYFLYRHDFADVPKELFCRTSATLAGLAAAPEFPTGVGGVYPTVKKFGATFHLYVFDGVTGHARHYTSAAAIGAPWTYRDDWPLNYASDPSVDFDPARGAYFAASKTRLGDNIVLQRSPSPGGPWTAARNVFLSLPAGLTEVADPEIHITPDGRIYLFFAGYDGRTQRIMEIQLDGSSLLPISFPIALVEPTGPWPWMTADGAKKIFNPVFISGDNVEQRDRIYFAVNPSGPGVSCGWGFVEY
jgi:hypothetical protein